MSMTQEHNVPALRFSEFSEEWTISKIQDLIDRKMIIGHLDGNHGELYPRSEEFSSEGIPYIAANDFYKGSIDFNNCKKLPEVRAKKFKKGIAKNGDVLFAHNATVGPTTVLETDLDFVILSTTATYFRCDLGKLSNWFLKAFFESEKFVRQCHRVKFQSTRSQVPITAQRKFYIGLPTLLEQQKIASFLSSVNRKITQLGQKKVLLQRYKKGMMQKLFSQELRFKDAQGHDFPDWEEKRLGELGETFGGLTGKTKENFGFGLPYIQYMQIFSSSKIDIARCGFVDIGNGEKQNCVQYGDVFFTTSSETPLEIGTASVLLNNVKEMYLNSFCFGYRPNLNLVSPQFVQFAFREPVFRKKVVRLAQGSTRFNMSKIALMKISFLLPTLPEQQKIADFLSSIDRKIELISTELDHAKTFKKGLLQQMFI